MNGVGRRQSKRAQSMLMADHLYSPFSAKYPGAQTLEKSTRDRNAAIAAAKIRSAALRAKP